MERVLLLMTTRTYRAGAFVEAARRLELDVVVGAERGQALAAANPGGHLTVDLSSPATAARRIAAFASRRPLAAVVAADDEGAPAAAAAARALGLRHHPPEAVASARDKGRFRQLLAAAGLDSRPFILHRTDQDPAELARRAPYPCVLKPLSLAGSRGVIRADGPEELLAARERLGRLLAGLTPPGAAPPGMLVESFVPGPEVALEGLVETGRLRVLALFDKPDALDGPFFEETIYVTPSRLGAKRQREIAASVQSAVAAVGLTEGAVHAELRLGAGAPVVLEIAPRSIGGLCSRALRFTGGRTLEELILLHALGRPTAGLEREVLASGVMMIPIPRAGVLRAVDGREAARSVPAIEDLRLTIPLGHPVVPLPEGDRYLGFLFARASRPEDVEAALREAHRRLVFTITDPASSGGEARARAT